jgi:RNA polymerase sigma factor (sigma-70 family)
MIPRPTVHIVDDDPDILEALTELMKTIDLSVATYQSAEDFLEKYELTGPGCLVLDVRMPGRSGLQLQKELNARGACPPLIFITGHGDIPMTVEAFKAGAVGFQEKPLHPQQLCDEVQEAVRRDQQVWRQREEKEEVERRLSCLAPPEREVFDLVIAGKTNKEIGQELCLSIRSVEHRRARLMTALRVKSRRELLELVMPLSSPAEATPPPSE